jgi:hypothetical protein
MNYIRKITKIKNFIASCVLWNGGTNKRNESAPLYFIDGLLAINSKESMLVGENQPELYCFNVGQYNEFRQEIGLKDQDVVLGRKRNWILFRAGNLTIKSSAIKITCNSIDVEANSINFNGISIQSLGGKILINGKEIAVVGGDISTITNKITTSGQ